SRARVKRPRVEDLVPRRGPLRRPIPTEHGRLRSAVHGQWDRSRNRISGLWPREPLSGQGLRPAAFSHGPRTTSDIVAALRTMNGARTIRLVERRDVHVRLKTVQAVVSCRWLRGFATMYGRELATARRRQWVVVIGERRRCVEGSTRGRGFWSSGASAAAEALGDGEAPAGAEGFRGDLEDRRGLAPFELGGEEHAPRVAHQRVGR